VVVSVLKMFRIKEYVPSSILRRKSESEICGFQLFQKHQRTDSFHERTSKEQKIRKVVFSKKIENQGSITKTGF
jgi:hypothetical protein